MPETVIAAKTCHKGSLFGHISNCGGTLKLTDFIGIKFVGINDQFLQIQVICTSDSEPVKSSTWVKTKAVKKVQAVKESQVALVKDVETEDLI